MTSNLPPTRPQECALEIIEDVYRCKIPIPNNPLDYVMSYLIKSRNGCTIIDVGWDTPESLSAWEKQLGQLGLSLQDIRQVVITHLHPDHYGLAGKLRQISGAQIVMSAPEAEQLGARYENYHRLLEEVAEFLLRNGVPSEEVPALQSASLPALEWVVTARPDRVVEEGDVLEAGPLRLQVLYTPGHTRGHMCLYAAQERLLFSGDHVLPTITPNVSLNPQSSANPLGDYLKALGRIEELEVNLVLPAHEFAFSNLAERVREIQEHHRRRLEEILGLLGGEAKTAYTVACRVNWDTGPWETLSNWNRRAAVMETLAHLEYLRSEGKVASLNSTEQVLYHRA
ncbi:MAG: MBL fold metallo-hydrolase [Clostridia bacterium]|nr:MBL fold metallo-hydrolase [Clostridia bacterium]MDH7573419.1 MBL fold metallo-hydrolase [Clostridia bacterium]